MKIKLFGKTALHLYHFGDDVLGLEWNTKMNSIGGEVLEGIQKSIDIAEEKYKGLVIANKGANFSAGANVGMIFMFAIEQEYDELDMAIRMFQNTMMRVRYSAVPVVVAPHGLTLGGGCEINLHADKVLPAAETYIGLVELGVGLIPGGGGTKEFALRAADEMHEDEPETITLKNRFFTIATAKVATSAFEAFDLGILRKGQDVVSINHGRRIGEAKQAVLEMYDQGYVMPVQRKDIKVFGRSALGRFICRHQRNVARKLCNRSRCVGGKKIGLCNVRRRFERTNFSKRTIYFRSRTRSVFKFVRRKKNIGKNSKCNERRKACKELVFYFDASFSISIEHRCVAILSSVVLLLSLGFNFKISIKKKNTNFNK